MKPLGSRRVHVVVLCRQRVKSLLPGNSISRLSSFSLVLSYSFSCLHLEQQYSSSVIIKKIHSSASEETRFFDKGQERKSGGGGVHGIAVCCKMISYPIADFMPILDNPTETLWGCLPGSRSLT